MFSGQRPLYRATSENFPVPANAGAQSRQVLKNHPKVHLSDLLHALSVLEVTKLLSGPSTNRNEGSETGELRLQLKRVNFDLLGVIFPFP